MKKITIFIAGLIVGLAISGASAMAIGGLQTGTVTPIVFVRYELGRFIPVKGDSVGISWSKDQVTAVVEVKKDIGDFTPVLGNTVGVHWSESEVVPFVEVIKQNGAWYYSKSQ